MTDNTYVSCYTFYDNKGRRLAAFCRFKEPTEAEIFILSCSKSDNFSKKFARNKYEEYLTSGKLESIKPIIFTKHVKPEQGSLNLLLEYLRSYYYVITYDLRWVPQFTKY